MNLYIIMCRDENNKMINIKKLMKRDNSVYLSMIEIEKMLLCNKVDDIDMLDCVPDIFFDALETLLLSTFDNIIIEPFFCFVDNQKNRCNFVGSFFRKYGNIINKIFYVCDIKGLEVIKSISDKEKNDYKIDFFK